MSPARAWLAILGLLAACQGCEGPVFGTLVVPPDAQPQENALDAGPTGGDGGSSVEGWIEASASSGDGNTKEEAPIDQEKGDAAQKEEVDSSAEDGSVEADTGVFLCHLVNGLFTCS